MNISHAPARRPARAILSTSIASRLATGLRAAWRGVAQRRRILGASAASVAAAALWLPAAAPAAELIVNGGFETGNFTGWTQTPAASGSFFGVNSIAPHTGTYAAYFGATGSSFDAISQTFTTVQGASYALSFWLRDGGGTPAHFQAVWAGGVVYNTANTGAFAYQQQAFTEVATGASTTLVFQGLQNPSVYFLDDVSVTLQALPANYWLGPGTSWNAANWASDSAGTPTTNTPNAWTDVTFSANGAQPAGAKATTLDADFTIHSLTINDTNPVTIGGANILTISGSTGTTGITVNSGAGLFTISSALTLAGGSQTITVSNAAGMVISGAVHGSIGLDKEGAGTLTLSGINDYTGGTTLGSGAIGIGNDSALSSGGVTVAATGGSVFAAGADHSISNGFTLNGTLTVTGDPSGAHNLALSGSLTGAGAVTMNGTGSLTLTAANTYTGGTTVNAGTLLVNNTTGSGTGTSLVTVNGGPSTQGTLGGTGIITGGVTLATNSATSFAQGAILNPGTAGTAGTLTINTAGLTTQNFSRLNFDLNTAQTVGSNVNDLISTNVLPSFGATTQVNINALGTLSVGLYTLVNGYTGTLTTFGNLSLNPTFTGDSSHSGILENNSGALQLLVTGATPAAAYWAGSASANWNTQDMTTAGTNWRTGAATGVDTFALPGATTDVHFYTTTPAAGNLGSVTLGQDFTINTLTFDGGILTSAVTFNSGNTLTINNAGGLTVNSGAGAVTLNNAFALGIDQTWTNNSANLLTIGGNVTNGANLLTVTGTGNTTIGGAIGSGSGGLTKTGTGTLTLTGTNTYIGNTTVNGGTLQVSGGGKITATSSITIDGAALNNATMTVDGTGASGISVNTKGGITVGGTRTGTFNVISGGKVTSASGVIGQSFGSVGTATVTGAGSTWAMTGDLLVDTGGTGTLMINNGGVVSNVNGFIARALTDLGTVTVDGAALDGTPSQWNNLGDVTVGDFGPGVLNITNGGVVTSVNGVIGNNSGSVGVATVSGAGSKWTMTGDLMIGVSGNGTLNIQNGGVVTNVNGNIDRLRPASGIGTVTVDGAGSAWNNSGALNVGIGGTGTLNIQNAGVVNVGGGAGAVTLALNATSTGTLNIGNGGGAGTLNAAIVTGGAGTAVINFNHTDAAYTFSPVIAGSITVNQLGSGATILSGANTYTGGTFITGGVLGIFNEGNLGAALGPLSFNGGALRFLAPISNFMHAITLNAGGGTIDTPAGSDSTLSGVISGPGGLTKSGAGALTLSAVNTYGGGTSITGGALAISNDNNLGAATGPLNFSNGGTLKTLAAITSGRSGVLGAGGGTFDANGFDSTFSGVISGPGGLTKSGAGALTLTGASTYTGNSNINAGALFVDGSLASANVNVNPGGTLGGNGTFSGSVNNLGGIISPGHSPGTITVNGNFTQSPAGTLKIEIGGLSAGQFDLLKVGGAARLGGTLQLVQLNGFQFAVGDSVTFLTAGGGVSGTFGTVINPFSSGRMIGTQVVYGGNSVSVQGVQNSFARLVSAVAAGEAGLSAPANPTELPRLPASISGQTRNQMAVAIALDESLFDARNAKLIGHLDHESLDKVLGDLDRIAPDELTSIYQIAVAQSKVQTFNLQRRLNDVRSGSNGFSAAGLAMNGSAQGYSGPLGVTGQLEGPQGPEGKSDKKMVLAPSPDNRWGVFVTGNGEWANVGDTSNAAGYDLTSAGFTLGIDYKVTPNFVIGLAAGYARGSADLTESGRVTADGGKLSLYTSYFTGGFYADAAVQGGYNSYDTRRNGVDGTARGSTDGGELTALFGTGYQWKAGSLTFGPTGTFESTYVGLGSFTEAGSLAPLNFPDQHQESIRSTFGAKAIYDWKLGSMTLKPEVRAGWQHDYGDVTFGMKSSFANGAGPEFLVHGPATGRDGLVVGAGVALQFTDRVSTYIYYDGELARTNYQAHSVSGGFRFEF